jgi:hypothetical protein
VSVAGVALLAALLGVPTARSPEPAGAPAAGAAAEGASRADGDAGGADGAAGGGGRGGAASADGVSQGTSGAGDADEVGGRHLRVVTAHGPVHLFQPAGYDRRTAGLVVYVHGLYVDVDQAWREHRLGEQFAASRLNALFLAPEAPASAAQPPAFSDLRALIATALRRARLRRPRGPLVAVGHSGAYRTLVPWLAEPSLRHLVLIDALYGNEGEFRAWLNARRDHQMTLVVKGTARWADPFVRAFPHAVTLSRIPSAVEGFSPAQRAAKLLCLRSQYGHFELVTEGKALPVLLGRTGLRRLPDAAPSLAPSTPGRPRP